MNPFDNATRAQASLMDTAMAGLQLASRAMELPSPRQARMFHRVKEILRDGPETQPDHLGSKERRQDRAVDE